MKKIIALIVVFMLGWAVAAYGAPPAHSGHAGGGYRAGGTNHYAPHYNYNHNYNYNRGYGYGVRPYYFFYSPYYYNGPQFYTDYSTGIVYYYDPVYGWRVYSTPYSY